jgi:2-polyprenyl-3-methyl-5-hydroxy-6-metoxy-1,4-benzoquinol methylase
VTSATDGHDERFEHQAAQYSFPYHWLPSNDRPEATIGRTLPWGLEYLAVLEATAELVTATRPERVLDFGCGDGRLSVELARRGVPEVVGVDLVERAVAFARAFGLPWSAQLRFERLHVQELEAGVFDTAVAMEVLEHIHESQLAEVVEALWQRIRPGGSLIVSVPTTNTPPVEKHERHYTEVRLREHLAPRFDVHTIQYVHRATAMNRVLRRALTNRFVSLEDTRARRLIAARYRRSGLRAEAGDGAHLIAHCRRT